MRTTRAAAATIASATSPRPLPPAASRCRSPCSRTAGCARATTSWRIPAAGACAPASPPSPRGRGACPATCRTSADRHQRLGGLVPALDVAPGRLALPVVGDQALLEDRRLGTRVAAVPARAHPELVQRPVDGAAEPRLGSEHAELEVHEVLLEGERALLLRRAVAVGLGPELRDHDRLPQIAGAERVKVGGELP